jgi:hypothetical protein
MSGMFRNALVVPSRVNKTVIAKAIAIVGIIVVASLTIACVPLIPALEDYFVQGMYYDPEYKVFIGFPSKVRHLRILETYYYNETFSKDTSWDNIAKKVDNMFSKDYGTFSRKPVHFYGNDGLCLFKYFVRSDDPRKSRGFSDQENIVDNKENAMMWTMLGVNLFCFVLIALSYVMINIKTRQSAKRSGQDENPARVRENRAIQTRVTIIIGTDFACWVPFIIICFLHNLGSFDATYWYGTFAMIVLPINSVINPVLYDNIIKEYVDRIVREASVVIAGSRIIRFLRQFRLRRNERIADGGNAIVQICISRLEGDSTEPRESPGKVAEAEEIQSADNMEEGPCSDIREMVVAAPEDIVMETEM